ncbi:arginine deiminase [Alkalithermobacter thermoalcaliphilus JW-YL-7 = DSM 7308]|uniref:Arginine deiminase n=1 Tax=Alkalithermobacter thermoalcaliphilus JW-YL-7 = DSM 7308 TaxID=1121328 RepID=A0A150FPC4_CLOPD|nr:Arginine deiminase [[Clostridium] paradoxum JW-YL-7 = DSM 7308]SHL21551.1 arginine deiminase [[Clostridium] paradoxum JW-YL-7 = DSM 7308]
MEREKISVYSEIGKLKKVLLHRPGREIENITPQIMSRLLFDDIPYLEVARNEHDEFANILRKNKVEVLYLDDLVSQAIKENEIKNMFIDEFIDEANINSKQKREAIKEYLLEFNDTKEMIAKMIEGIRKEEIKQKQKKSLIDIIDTEYPFIVDPMPNLYFTRDPFASIGRGICLNKMKTITRNRETLFSKYIFKYHPEFKNENIPFWYKRENDEPIEGGDILVLNEKIIAIGISERTSPDAIENFAKNIFSSDESFETILAFDIPKKRAFMHLDTVFTMVDYNKFTIHPEIEKPLTIYSINKKSDEEITINKETMKLEDILKKYLNLDDVVLIRCGNGDKIHSGREQWNDGSNTLAIAPGEVIVYSRNHVTNRLLEEHGIKLHIMPSSELSRGRGGPRCMSMPIIREKLK